MEIKIETLLKVGAVVVGIVAFIFGLGQVYAGFDTKINQLTYKTEQLAEDKKELQDEIRGISRSLDDITSLQRQQQNILDGITQRFDRFDNDWQQWTARVRPLDEGQNKRIEHVTQLVGRVEGVIDRIDQEFSAIIADMTRRVAVLEARDIGPR